MRKLLIMACLLALGALGATNILPTCYYTYSEVSQMLADHESQYPDIAKRYQIGVTQQDQVPIYALRISDNVATDEEEPALLFVGQVHAEEVLGVQITMSNIAEILAHRYQLPYSQWINQLDIWFVPTLNPEGHNVVTSNIDTSWRKNKHDNNLNGQFDFSPQVGYDIDGVDINRNFDFNWCHGDTLYQNGEFDEVWDYYRGPAPMSESENIALKNLADQRKFVYSIVWHSSRTGNLSEKCYYPFNWKNVRPSPDHAFAQAICNGVAGQIINQAGSATYQSLPNLSRQGAFHDWLYKQYGTLQILIECGTHDLQPDSLLMVNTVDRCSNATRWLLNRALPYSSAVPSSSLLTGNIRDAVTNAPLEAEIIVEEHHAPWFVPRTSFASTGRYWKALPTGSFTIRVRKRGYQDLVVPGVMVNNSSWTIRNFNLQPLQPLILDGTVKSGTTPLNAEVRIFDPNPVTLQVAGEFEYPSFEGTYPIEIFSEGYYPYLGTVTLSPGTTQHHYQLSEAYPIFSEDWESGTDGWQIQGPWVVQNELSAGGSAITDSWGGWGFYAMNCDVWIKPQEPIYIPGSTMAMLYFDSHLYTEYNYDFATVEASVDNTDWTVLWQKSGKHDSFNREYVSLCNYAGTQMYLRFRLTDASTDIALVDPGWTIDNIRIIGGSSVPATDPALPPAFVNSLGANYPNPFNPETTLRFSLAAAGPARLCVYNLKGQLVRVLADSQMPAGSHSLVWDGKDDQGREQGSGVYFYRLESGDFRQTRKMILVK